MTSILAEAENAVRAGRVKLYMFKPSGRQRWVVVGKHGEYLVLPGSGYCSCHDFFFRVISGEKPTCYHLVAARIAKERNQYELIEEKDSNYDKLMNKWIKGEESKLET